MAKREPHYTPTPQSKSRNPHQLLYTLICSSYPLHIISCTFCYIHYLYTYPSYIYSFNYGGHFSLYAFPILAYTYPTPSIYGEAPLAFLFLCPRGVYIFKKCVIVRQLECAFPSIYDDC